MDSHLNKFPFEMIDPVIALDESEKWDKLWFDLLLKGHKFQRDTDEGIAMISKRHFTPPTRRSR